MREVVRSKGRPPGLHPRDTGARTVVTVKTSPARIKTREGTTRDPEFEKKHPRAGKGRVGGGQFIQGNSSGPAAQAVRERLGATDGNFKAAVMRFQRRRGLAVDGLVGTQTAAALLGKAKRAPGELTEEDRKALRRLGKKRVEEGHFDPSQPRDRAGRWRQTRATLIANERELARVTKKALMSAPRMRSVRSEAAQARARREWDKARAAGAPLPWHLGHLTEGAQMIRAWQAALDAFENGNDELTAQHATLAMKLEERAGGVFREELHPRSRLGRFREKIIDMEKRAKLRAHGVKSSHLVTGPELRVAPQLIVAEARGDFTPSLHPRDRMGRFREVLGGMKTGERLTIGGVSISRTRGKFQYRTRDGGGQAGTIARMAEELERTASSTEVSQRGTAPGYEGVEEKVAGMSPEAQALLRKRGYKPGQTAAEEERGRKPVVPAPESQHAMAGLPEPTPRQRAASRVASLGGSRATSAELRRGAEDIEALPNVTEEERRTAGRWRQGAERMAGEEAAGGALSDRRPSAASLGIGGSAANPVRNASGTWHGTPHWVVRKPMPKRLKTPAREMAAVDTVIERAQESVGDARPVSFGPVKTETWGGITRPIVRPTTDVKAPGSDDRMVANADFLANVQNKLKGGQWRVNDKGQFLYVKDGRVEGIVMGVREKPTAGGHTPAPPAPTPAPAREPLHRRGSDITMDPNLTPEERTRRRKEQAALDELGRSRTAGYYKAREERRASALSSSSRERGLAQVEAERRSGKARPRIRPEDMAAAELGEPVEGHKPQAPSAEQVRSSDISTLAQMIRSDWAGKVNFAAKPYLDAMRSLGSVKDRYGQDTGSEIVQRFLSNAGSWRGPTAKAVKAELRRRLSESVDLRAMVAAADARANGNLELAEQYERRAVAS